jgi:hypothetical protein
MRRLIALAVSLLVLASVEVSAQRGGGHGASAGHGGFSGHSGGFSGHASGGGGRTMGGHAMGGHAMTGAHSRSGFTARSGVRGPFSHSQLSSRRGSRHSGVGVRIRSYGFRNHCYGYGCGYGYPWLGAGIDPYWWWDSGSSYDQDQQEQIGLANQMNQQNLEEQRMRQQGDQESYARSAPPSPHQAERQETIQPTMLIFRDQRKQEVHNYAIVGQTLWDFAPQRTEKIPLSDLDLPATEKVNEERGIDFRLPNAHEGQ